MPEYIAQKVLPKRPNVTYCNSGRSAFYLMIKKIRPHRVYFPNFICSVLIDNLKHFYPEIEIDFYEVYSDLTFERFEVNTGELIVIIEYFGLPTQKLEEWPIENILIDLTHIPFHMWHKYEKYDFFGSLRKLNNLADGGFHSGFEVHDFGEVENIESKLNFLATNWDDLKEAEIELDRSFRICDMSSSSLSVFLEGDSRNEAKKRLENWGIISRALEDFVVPLPFNDLWTPYLIHIEFDSRIDRNLAFSDLSKLRVFSSIHWETPELVSKLNRAGAANERFGERILNLPLGFQRQDYNLEEIVKVLSKYKGRKNRE